MLSPPARVASMCCVSKAPCSLMRRKVSSACCSAFMPWRNAARRKGNESPPPRGAGASNFIKFSRGTVTSHVPSGPAEETENHGAAAETRTVTHPAAPEPEPPRASSKSCTMSRSTADLTRTFATQSAAWKWLTTPATASSNSWAGSKSRTWRSQAVKAPWSSRVSLNTASAGAKDMVTARSACESLPKRRRQSTKDRRSSAKRRGSTSPEPPSSSSASSSS
mmetsp:Transcript_15130/g.50824  ORF Transcript_15130/g.50824 Transcript_15130/m.50824 type:complete len:222 (+) Transcript_15130:197-862(+)